jgi:hypothetical protein
VLEDLLDHLTLRRLDERDHFHHPAACGAASGSISYTRLMNMAQVWLARLRGGAGAASAGESAAASAAFERRAPSRSHGRGPCSTTSRNSESGARPSAECTT